MRGAGAYRSADAEAQWRRAVDAAKDRKNLSDVIGRHTKLKRRGRELVGLCPFHEEKTPSFEVNDAKGVFYCHGCAATGDHYTALQKLDGLTFREAYEALSGDRFPTVAPEDRARAKAEDDAARAAAIDDVRLMWSRCVPIAGTLAERYLRDVRGIRIAPAAVRFGIVPPARDEDGHWKPALPAAVFSCHHETAGLVGLQRVFLRDDGSDKRWGKRSKLSLGRPKGAAVRLGQPCDAEHYGCVADEVVICEGPEDGLTLFQRLPQRTVWVALGTAMMPEIDYPASVTTIVIAGQNDAPGRAAVGKAENALLERGFAVSTIWPAAGFKDWNDELRGIRC